MASSLLLPSCCLAQLNKIVVHPPDPLTVVRGASVEQTLELAVLPGFHVNSDKPKDETLIPLKLTWTNGPLETQSVSYPEAKEIKVGSQQVMVFTGKFQIQTKFHVPAGIAKGSSTMTGKLHYQACNDTMCFRPSSVAVTLPVSVE